MVSLLYKPDHPQANKDGFVTKDNFYSSEYLKINPMMNGNQPVRLNFISDTMEPARHMALPPGSPPIDSKAKFRQVTKDHGCIEVGNETKHLTKPRQRINPSRKERREDIKRSIYNLRNKTSN